MVPSTPVSGRGNHYIVEIKVEWGNSLAQEREAEEARTEEMELQQTKPFARTRDDPVIERMLKEKEFAVAVCRSIKSGHARRETTATDSELESQAAQQLSQPSLHRPDSAAGTNIVAPQRLNTKPEVITSGPSATATAAISGCILHYMADDHPGNDPWHGVDHGALKEFNNHLQLFVVYDHLPATLIEDLLCIQPLVY
ncbi:BUD13 protein [Tanacetum coccineum]